ncbi:MAG: ABC transporter permease [Promethearchaeota archaeon]
MVHKSEKNVQSPSTEKSTFNASQRKPRDSSLSRRLYVTKYVLNGIRHHKRRSISLLIGIMIGVALISSVFVWTETGARVAVDDYFASISFHYYCVQNQSPTTDDPQAIFSVKEFVDTHATTRASHVVFSSIALIDSTFLNPTDYYLPYAYARGIKDCQVFFVDNDFLARAERSFRIIDGQFRLSLGSVLVSQHVVEDLEEVIGRQVSVGSIIDLSVAQRYQNTRTIGALNITNLVGLRIGGIYQVITHLEPLLESFPTQSRRNWDPIQDSETVFGWYDSVIVSKNVFDSDIYDQIAVHVMFPRLLVEIIPASFYSTRLEELLVGFDALLTDIQMNNDVTVGGRNQLLFLQEYIEVYYERQTMVFLVLPMVILSVLLTTFTASLFLSNRRTELGILRSRGTSYQQLYSILMIEFLVLATIGTVLGGLLGILLGCLIPSAFSFLAFNPVSIFRHLSLTSINLTAWVIAGVACIVPATIYIFQKTRSFLRSEIYAELRETNSKWKSSSKFQVAYAFIIILISIPLTYVVLSIPITTDIALIFFIFVIGFWILLADAIARLIRPGIATFSRLFTPAIGQKSQLFVKSLRVKRTRVVPLLMILLLTFSITIFSAVEAQTYQIHLDQQINYYVGADIHVYSDRVFASRINEITALPQIDTATAFIEVQAEIGESDLKLMGVNPSAYAEVGNWDESSMVDDDYRAVFARLAANRNGIILPAHIATLYNRRVGDTIPVQVRDQRSLVVDYKLFDIVGIMNKAPGLGYSNPSDPQLVPTPNPGFGFQKSNAFALCHQHYFLVEIPSFDPYAVTDSTRLFLAKLNPSQDVQAAQDALEDLEFIFQTWSPYTFDLEEAYYDGYLFSQGVIGLLSVGFLASLAISVVALTVFVSIIVSERKTEYAILRALGGSRRDVTSMVFVEFVSLILLAFFFSVVVGVSFSWLLMFVIIKLFPQPFIVPFTIIYPLNLLIVVLGFVVLGLLTGAYLPARRAGQVQVSSLLRNL